MKITPILKGAKYLNRYLTKENLEMANKFIKKWLTSLDIWEMQTIPTTRYPHPQERKGKRKKCEASERAWIAESVLDPIPKHSWETEANKAQGESEKCSAEWEKPDALNDSLYMKLYKQDKR